MDKVVISIIGTTTAGKTSLVKLLLTEGMFARQVYCIPQTTCREPRLDDDSRVVKVVDRGNFAGLEFISQDTVYGTTKSDLDKFLSSDSTCAIATIGTGDIEPIREYLASKETNCVLKVVCLRLDGRSPEFEKIALEESLTTLFKPNIADTVRPFQLSLIDRFYCNESFLSKQADFVMNKRELNLAGYLLALRDGLNLPIVASENIIRIKSEEIRQYMERQRILGKFVKPKTSKTCLIL